MDDDGPIERKGSRIGDYCRDLSGLKKSFVNPHVQGALNRNVTYIFHLYPVILPTYVSEGIYKVNPRPESTSLECTPVLRSTMERDTIPFSWQMHTHNFPSDARVVLRCLLAGSERGHELATTTT